MNFKDKVERAQDNLFTRSDGKGNLFIIPVGFPKSKGLPVPSSYNIATWPEYVAKYDPFNWDCKHQDAKQYIKEMQGR